MDPQDFEQVQEVGDNGVEDEENLDQEYPAGTDTEEVTADELVDQPADDELEDDMIDDEQAEDDMLESGHAEDLDPQDSDNV